MKKIFLLTLVTVTILLNIFNTTAQTSIAEYYIVKLSSDNQMAAGAAYNRSTVEFRLRIWDAQNGATLIDLQGTTAPILDFAWSPDSKRLIGSDGDFNVIVWCTDQTNTDCIFGNEITRLQDITDAVNAMDWHPNGNLVTVSRYASPSVQIWNMNSYTPIAGIYAGEISDAAWSPDGNQIAIVGYYEGLYVFDIDLPLSTLNTSDYKLSGDKDKPILSVAWDQTGSRIAYGMLDSSVVVVNSSTGGELARLEAQDFPVTALAWSPDNTRLATASSMGTVIVWNPTTDVSQVIATIQKQDTGTAYISWKPDGTLLYPDESNFPVGLPTPIPTSTPIPPTATHTPIPPTATFTPIPPTATFTPMPPSGQIMYQGCAEQPKGLVPALCMSEADGSGTTFVLEGNNIHSPAVSSDNRLAYVVTTVQDRTITTENIHVYNPADGSKTKITFGPLDTDPAWNPAGTRIA